MSEQRMRWYVVQAFSGYEGRVAKSLKEHIKMHGMEDKFGEVLVPTEEVIEMRAGQKRKSERKFFPGYVLVQMLMDETSWHLVRSVPRVMGFIGGTSDRPAPISDKEADAILNRLQDAHDKPRPKTLFEPGEMVRVAVHAHLQVLGQYDVFACILVAVLLIQLPDAAPRRGAMFLTGSGVLLPSVIEQDCAAVEQQENTDKLHRVRRPVQRKRILCRG